MNKARVQKKGVDYGKIKQLIELVERNGLTELTVEEEGLSVTIKAEVTAGGTAVVSEPVTHSPVKVEVQIPVPPLSKPVVPSEHLVRITSPMIGVFYRSPSPDSPMFVEIGDEIEVGQTIGLIEAMKVFSEIPSEVTGRVVDIPVESAKLVQQGDVLVVVDTSQIG